MSKLAKSQPSLVSRFAAATAVLAGAAVILAVVFFVALHAEFFAGAVDTTLRGFSLSLAEHIWAAPTAAEERAAVAGMARRHGVGIIVEADGESYAVSPLGAPVDPALQARAGWRYRRVEAAGPDGRRIVFFWDMMRFAHSHVPLLVGLVVLLVLLIGATYAFQLAHLRPLAWLRDGVEAVSRGNFQIRVPVVRRDEIGEVARAFNRMTEQVERMLSDRERLLADVSHELRSPLTRVKVALELLPESAERQAIERDARQMEALITVLLERERIRARSERLSARPVDLGEVVRDAVAGFGERAPGVVSTAPKEPVQVAGDAALLGVVLHNLLDNALKFSSPDSPPVEVRWRAAGTAGEGDAAELEVIDDGPGIPEAERERVFEPFAKLDPARGHRTGYGLGLDLCKRIVEAHGGTIGVRSRGEFHGKFPGGRGTRILVRLPRPS